MREPKTILPPGTKILTHEALHPTRGFMVKEQYLQARRPSARATLGQFVGGHGGDVYWARHDDGTVAVYGWPEFELVDPSTGEPIDEEPEPPRARWSGEIMGIRVHVLDDGRRIVDLDDVEKILDPARYPEGFDAHAFGDLFRKFARTDWLPGDPERKEG